MTGAPTVACPDCDGTIPAGCHRCARRGLRRAQLVLTVANLDTGAVASREVLPGTLEPRPQPAGGWVVDLTPRVRELAAEAGVAVTVDPVVVPVPTGWRPDLPAAERQEWAARALAGAARPAWRVWVGRSTAPPRSTRHSGWSGSARWPTCSCSTWSWRPAGTATPCAGPSATRCPAPRCAACRRSRATPTWRQPWSAPTWPTR
ncbi:hypothetical protein ACQP2H_06505 [Micromonospora sp. CA-248260]|uniref:hypothetical protein n=1 Tax=Micromonospora sp. CA-248260 TaxID=3239962 RepID=UPI003D8F85AC